MSEFDISIAGEINLDLILCGLPEEMPVERELLGDRFLATLGSSSAIVAHNVAAMGRKGLFLNGGRLRRLWTPGTWTTE